jgi:hypothetical protein
MSTKGTYIEELDIDQQTEIDAIQLEVDKNGVDIAQLTAEVDAISVQQVTDETNINYLGKIKGFGLSDWDTAGQVLTIPHSTGTWVDAFSNKNMSLSVNGIYLISLNFTTFINTGSIGHNPITIGCELFQINTDGSLVALATVFSGNCGINTNNMTGTGTAFDQLNAVGCNMSFPINVFDSTLPFSMSLYYFFNNSDNVDIQLVNNVPDSSDPLRWWRSSVNINPMPFTMTLMGL